MQKTHFWAILGSFGLNCGPFRPILGHHTPHVSIVTPNSHCHRPYCSKWTNGPLKMGHNCKKNIFAILGSCVLNCCPFRPIFSHKASHVSIFTPNGHYHLWDWSKWTNGPNGAILGSCGLNCWPFRPILKHNASHASIITPSGHYHLWDCSKSTKGRVQKKIQNVNFFQKGWGASIQKFTFLKSLYTVKRGSKMDFFNTRICFGKLWEQQMKFWDTNI